MKFPALFATLLIASSPVVAQPKIDKGRLDAIFAKYDKPGEPGGVVLIQRNGKTVYSKAVGLASLEQGVRNTSETVFSLDYGECREFTALTVAMLADEGKLSLDDSVRKFLPELPALTAPITLRHLIESVEAPMTGG